MCRRAAVQTDALGPRMLLSSMHLAHLAVEVYIHRRGVAVQVYVHLRGAKVQVYIHLRGLDVEVFLSQFT